MFQPPRRWPYGRNNPVPLRPSRRRRPPETPTYEALAAEWTVVTTDHWPLPLS